jgi:hypothetical protein
VLTELCRDLLTGLLVSCCQDNHLSGKPGNVRDFGYCQGSVRDYDNSHGSVRGVSESFTMFGKWAPCVVRYAVVMNWLLFCMLFLHVILLHPKLNYLHCNKIMKFSIT